MQAGRSRIWLSGWVAAVLAAFATAAPAAFACRVAEVLDITAAGVQLDLAAPGSSKVWTGVGSDGAIRVVTYDGVASGFPVHRLDPGKGTAELLAAVDPTSVGAARNQTIAGFGADGTVYFITSDGAAIDPQQRVYRLVGQTLVQVVDLTAQGIALPLGGLLPLRVVGADNGSLWLVAREEVDPDLFDVVQIDPDAGSAALVATVDTAGAPGPPPPTPIVGSDGTVFFLAGDSLSRQKLYRRAGTHVEEVLDVTAAGFRIEGGPMIGGALDAAGARDGSLIVASRGFDARLRFLRLDPASQRVAQVGSVDLAKLTQSPSAAAAVAIGRDGRVHVIASSGMPAQQAVYRLERGPQLERVVDLTGRGVALTIDPTLRSSATTTGDVITVSTHPTFADLRRVHRLRPADGSAALLASVDLQSVGATSFTSESAIAPDGTVYFVLQEGLTPAHQTVRRLDGGALTPVIDVSAEGVSLDFAANMGGFPTGVGANGVITAVLNRSGDLDLRRVYRLDPAAGSAEFVVTVDLGLVSSMPAASPVFAPDGRLFFLVDSQEMTPQESLFRLDGGVLAEVVDLTAQGIDAPSLEPFAVGFVNDGSATLVSRDPSSIDLEQLSLYRLDPASGMAAPLCELDLGGTTAALPFQVRPIVARSGEVLFLIADTAIASQQSLYRLPEPAGGPGVLAALGALAALRRYRCATRSPHRAQHVRLPERRYSIPKRRIFL